MVARSGSEPALEMSVGTLDAMAAGGIYDQVGGGFHRYAVDGIWLVPHFEKMLYDNALLASAYLHGLALTGSERYREVVEETLDFLLRDMLLPEGGFASALDADTLGEEGTTYVWTIDELNDVLEPDEAELVIQRFGLTAGGNFEGSNVLFVAREVDGSAEALAGARRKLLDARSRRPQPARDDKALAAWNGLALAALAEAGLRLGRADYLDAARALAEFLLGPMSDERGRLYRTFRAGEAKIDGYLEDYANVANGLLELYNATGELRYLDESHRLARLALELFGDAGERRVLLHARRTRSSSSCARRSCSTSRRRPATRCSPSCCCASPGSSETRAWSGRRSTSSGSGTDFSSTPRAR